MDRKTNRPRQAQPQPIAAGIPSHPAPESLRGAHGPTRRPGPKRRPVARRLSLGLAAALVTGACVSGATTPSPVTPTPAAEMTAGSPCIKTESGDSCLPIAPESARVDRAQPSFSDPLNATNPLFPAGQVISALQLGAVDGQPFRVEVTLLAGARTIEWNGQQVPTLVSQYMAYLDGRIHEVAIDWYAQADDGSVWYFGEDVFNYENGVVADTHGTWLAGRDGPAAMIMPSAPRVGDVYRPENAPGFVFEEVTVKATGQIVDGPQGPVGGAILVQELHMDGNTEDKTFAPGYGEFTTGGGANLEAVALAVPTDVLSGPLPAQLQSLSTGAAGILETAQSVDWAAATAAVESMTADWETYRAGAVPPMLAAQMSDALVALAGAVDAHNPAEARQAAFTVGQASLDLQLRYRPPAEIDLARLDLWAGRLLVDAAASDASAVTGDVATLERIRDRVAHTFAASDASRLDAALGDLRVAADAQDLARASDAAAHLRDVLAGLIQAS